MALDLDTARKWYSDYLAENPSGRWRMDAAFAHAITKAYLAALGEVTSDPDKAVVRMVRLHAIRECRDKFTYGTQSWHALDAMLAEEFAQ